MELGLYKPGQGYWVRVLTAVFAGILVLSAGAWAWRQAERIPLPMPTYDLTLDSTTLPEEGIRLELLRRGEEGEVVIGQATVKEAVGGTRQVIVHDISLEGDRQMGEVQKIRSAAGDGYAAEVTHKNGIEVFDRIYLQGGITGVIVLVGAALIYWLVGVRPRTVDFLVHTDSEMKKVNWSTRRDIIGSTWVVVIASLLIALGLFVVDIVFERFFTLVGLLER